MCYVSSCDNPWPHLHIIPIEEVLMMDSIDVTDSDGTYGSLENVLKAAKADYQFNEVVDSIVKLGYQPGFATEIRHYTIMEGHHRLAAMQQISGYWTPWQELEQQGQWYDWETYLNAAMEESWNILMSSA